MPSVFYCDWMERRTISRSITSGRWRGLQSICLRIPEDLLKMRRSGCHPKPTESEVLGFFWQKIYISTRCGMFYIHTKFEEQYFRQKFVRETISQGKIVLPSRDFFGRDLTITSIGMNPRDIFEVKSCKVRSLMCAAHQHMSLIYFRFYQEKKEQN